MTGGALLVALALLGGTPPVEDVAYRVVDRRELDGTVLLVRQVPAQRVGGEPFAAATHWELRPVTAFFRVREGRIPGASCPSSAILRR